MKKLPGTGHPSAQSVASLQQDSFTVQPRWKLLFEPVAAAAAPSVDAPARKKARFTIVSRDGGYGESADAYAARAAALRGAARWLNTIRAANQDGRNARAIGQQLRDKRW